MSEKEALTPGFYFVRIEGIDTVAQLTSAGRWFIIGIETPIQVSDFQEIGPRVERPSTDGGWISVEDRLPEVGEEYNVVWDIGDGYEPVVTTVEFDAIRKIWTDHTYPDGYSNITHWQPLPPPPQSVESNKL